VALNIPLKIRCSKTNAFDDKAKEPFIDTSSPVWFDYPMNKAKTADLPDTATASRKKRRKTTGKPESAFSVPAHWLNNPAKQLDPKQLKRRRRIQNIALAILLFIVAILWLMNM